MLGSWWLHPAWIIIIIILILKKVFIEFITALLLFYVFWPRAMWGLSSPVRDQILTSCIGRWSLKHWTTRGVPKVSLFFIHVFNLFLWHMASRAHGLSSCDSWALLSGGIWDIRSLTRDQTLVSCTRSWRLNQWTIREVPLVFLVMEISKFALFCYNSDRKVLQGVWYFLEK